MRGSLILAFKGTSIQFSMLKIRLPKDQQKIQISKTSKDLDKKEKLTYH